MTRKQRRSVLIAICLSVLALAVGLVLFALEDSIVFFYSPSDIKEKNIGTNQRFRLGGLVEEGSFKRGQGTTVTFAITDNAKSVPVIYTGVLPDLFREGQGVVSEGKLDKNGTFIADSVLAKHDETYMPREVVESLKKRGVWQGEKTSQ
jgi:cytochrome c-type biogenesis protein CcmE